MAGTDWKREAQNRFEPVDEDRYQMLVIKHVVRHNSLVETTNERIVIQGKHMWKYEPQRDESWMKRTWREDVKVNESYKKCTAIRPMYFETNSNTYYTGELEPSIEYWPS